jgi:hypothetical protein
VLHGALLVGGPLSIWHVVYNRLGDPWDALVTLGYFVLLYGAVSAVVVLAVGAPVSALTRRRGRAADAGTTGGLLVLWSVALFFVVNYGLTYDQLPRGWPASLRGMLAYLALRTVAVVAVSWLLARGLTWVIRVLPARAWAALAVLLVGAHVGLPLALESAPEGSAASISHAEATSLARSARTHGRKVFFFGIDGADWRVVEPLLAAGRMPHLARLIAAGASGPLATLPDANSAVIWASIATGTRPAVHGVLDFYRIELTGMRGPGVFPVHRTFFKEAAAYLQRFGMAARRAVHRGSLEAVPIWEIVDGLGLTIGVVDGYYYSYPVGELANPRSWVIANGARARWRAAAAAGERLEPATLATYVRPRAAWDVAVPYLDRHGFRWKCAATPDLIDRFGQPRLLVLYSREPDVSQHLYWRWLEPERYPALGQAADARHAAAIPTVYEELDACLGRVLARLDAETVVVVASDHGHAPTILHQAYSQHRHGPPGVLVLAGSGIRSGARLTGAHVLDLHPTLLHLLGLPVPERVAGQVLAAALSPASLARTPVRHVSSYDGVASARPLPASASAERSARVLERLRALGYVND